MVWQYQKTFFVTTINAQIVPQLLTGITVTKASIEGSQKKLIGLSRFKVVTIEIRGNLLPEGLLSVPAFVCRT